MVAVWVAEALRGQHGYVLQARSSTEFNWGTGAKTLLVELIGVVGQVRMVECCR